VRRRRLRARDVRALIGSVQALALQHGIENSLLAKLTGAQRNLAADNLAGACGKLGSFLGEVSAQSGKKKIDAAAAQELTDDVSSVRHSSAAAPSATDDRARTRG